LKAKDSFQPKKRVMATKMQHNVLVKFLIRIGQKNVHHREVPAVCGQPTLQTTARESAQYNVHLHSKTRARAMATSIKELLDTQADGKWMLEEGEVGDRSSIRANQANSANASRPTRGIKTTPKASPNRIVLDKRTTTFAEQEASL
jgi:hypothetical protein